MLSLFACLGGIFLGLNFGVLVLLPVSLLGIGGLVCENLAAGHSFYANLGGLLLSLVAIQGGYMLGLLGRDIYGNLLARPHTPRSEHI